MAGQARLQARQALPIRTSWLALMEAEHSKCTLSRHRALVISGRCEVSLPAFQYQKTVAKSVAWECQSTAFAYPPRARSRTVLGQPLIALHGRRRDRLTPNQSMQLGEGCSRPSALPTRRRGLRPVCSKHLRPRPAGAWKAVDHAVTRTPRCRRSTHTTAAGRRGRTGAGRSLATGK